MKIKTNFFKIKYKIHLLWLPFTLILFTVFTFARSTNSQTPVTPKPQVLGVKVENLQVRGPVEKGPVLPIPHSDEAIDFTNTSASSVLIYDDTSGKVLAEKNVNSSHKIASLTKLMTGLVAYDVLDLEDYLTVEKNDILNVSPNLNLRIGDKIKTYDLFKAMLIGSCNDAALMLANHSSKKAGVAFENMMNKKASFLGMTSTHFSNPMGFDSSANFSTARDLRLLVTEAQKQSIFSTDGRQFGYSFISALGNKYHTTASNKLIKLDDEISNIKTGFTDQAGGAMISRATRDGNSVIIIVIGSDNRDADTGLLKEQIFSKFSWK